MVALVDGDRGKASIALAFGHDGPEGANLFPAGMRLAGILLDNGAKCVVR